MNLFNFLRARRKRNLIKKYITSLGPSLATRYGQAEYYSPERVRKTIEETGLCADELIYALVLYCLPKKFTSDQRAHGRSERYWDLRMEIVEYDFRHCRKREFGDIGGDLSSADQSALSGYGHFDIGGHF